MTSRFRFISTHYKPYGVKRLCRVLQVNRASYYAWKASAAAREARAAADAQLTAEIREIHQVSNRAYGAPRVTAEVGARREAAGRGPVNRKKVARLMREAGIQGRHQRRRKRTTVPDPKAPPAPDLVERDFTATAPNEKWVGDFTYVRIGTDQWLYFATVIDLFSRRLIGWSMAQHMRDGLVIDALRDAVGRRGGDVHGVIFHSDRGSQYTAKDFAHECAKHGIRRSMGKTGISYDNAAAESFFAGYKRETSAGRGYPDVATARRETFQWIAWYNNTRRHSTVGQLSPADFENRQGHAKLHLAI